MIIEIAFLGILVGYLYVTSTYNLIKVLGILLPFHLFIKNSFFFYFGGGSLFAFWKEIAVILLIWKVIKSGKSLINSKLVSIIGFYVFIAFIYFVVAQSYGDALAKLRDHIFTILLFLAISKVDLDKQQIKGIFLAFVIGAFLTTIGGFLQMFLFNIEISTIKGSIDFIDSQGYVQYRTVSARIMGFERMSGLFSGPNDFGLYCSFAFCICIYQIFAKDKIEVSAKVKSFTILTAIALAVCLIFSFSRAGWAICIITIGYLAVSQSIKLNPVFILAASIAFFITISTVVLFVPKVSTIIEASLSGKEASAAARGSILQSGLDKLREEPYGHGLATSDNRTGKTEFFVESAFLNNAYEIGVLGLVALILLHFQTISLLAEAKRKKLSPFASLAIGISCAALVVSFVSINTYGMPFIYFWWLILGLGLNRINVTPPSEKRHEILDHYSHV